jgi:hypothetical protein
MSYQNVMLGTVFTNSLTCEVEKNFLLVAGTESRSYSPYFVDVGGDKGLSGRNGVLTHQCPCECKCRMSTKNRPDFIVF